MEISILKEEEASKDKKIKIVDKNDMEEKFIIHKNFKFIKSISYFNREI